MTFSILALKDFSKERIESFLSTMNLSQVKTEKKHIFVSFIDLMCTFYLTSHEYKNMNMNMKI